MTPAKVCEAADKVVAMLRAFWPHGLEAVRHLDQADLTPRERAEHLMHVCKSIGVLVAEGRREKAMRWLGFAQGAAWALMHVSVAELAEHNRPDLAEAPPPCA